MDIEVRKNIELICKKLKIKGGNFGSKILLSQLHDSHSDVPKLIDAYILNCIPSCDVEHEGLYIHGSVSFTEQNTDFSPAIFIREFGFWTFATFYYGSAFVLDVKTDEILLVGPGNYFYKEGIPTCLGDKGHEPIGRKFVLEKSEPQADNLSEFFSLVIEKLDS